MAKQVSSRYKLKTLIWSRRSATDHPRYINQLNSNGAHVIDAGRGLTTSRMTGQEASGVTSLSRSPLQVFSGTETEQEKQSNKRVQRFLEVPNCVFERLRQHSDFTGETVRTENGSVRAFLARERFYPTS